MLLHNSTPLLVRLALILLITAFLLSACNGGFFNADVSCDQLVQQNLRDFTAAAPPRADFVAWVEAEYQGAEIRVFDYAADTGEK